MSSFAGTNLQRIVFLLHVCFNFVYKRFKLRTANYTFLVKSFEEKEFMEYKICRIK